jgi:hypothetical protein
MLAHGVRCGRTDFRAVQCYIMGGYSHRKALQQVRPETIDRVTDVLIFTLRWPSNHIERLKGTRIVWWAAGTIT